ncbi:hypothetical protein HYH02_000733 [Chlamydomonas schloesseri]|uniref:Uncharacterized protein n=1 Tax=Chlamydomonas schloesseri TaxID=2026947 RepID=A0A835WV66_9CHLO|nr:hypothetical protein HYH02_000733 [Chlamydomonas schloesseri]|eukprot:KAG2454903.1 hypothetical protein HYH02_000733 [Chlamydomonas schloesseri]
MRTLIMTSNETEVPHLNKVYAKYRERYEYFPDENEPDPKKWHAKFPGDFRAAVAPFAAHRHYGDSYKWMLYGDDDTVFFLPGVRKLLARFDPEQPLALSDNLWHDSRHPRLEAVRCLPCGFDVSKLPPAQLRTNNSYVPRAACPYCTREKACPPGRPDCDITGAHGGAGMIFSVGLMRQAALSYDNALGCMYSIYGCSGGDGLVSQCLWRAGYGFTDPGHSLQHDDPYKQILFDNMDGRWFLKNPIGQLVVGNCDEACQEALQHAVSYHVRGKSYPSLPKAAAFMYGIVEAHAAALDFIALQADTASRAGRAVGHRVLPGRHVPDPHTQQQQQQQQSAEGAGASGEASAARKAKEEGEEAAEGKAGRGLGKEERRPRKTQRHH